MPKSLFVSGTTDTLSVYKELLDKEHTCRMRKYLNNLYTTKGKFPKELS